MERDNVNPAVRPFDNNAQICLMRAVVDFVTNVLSVAGINGKLACKEDDAAWVCRRVLRRCKDITKQDIVDFGTKTTRHG